jgi:hypothetical protein
MIVLDIEDSFRHPDPLRRGVDGFARSAIWSPA